MDGAATPQPGTTFPRTPHGWPEELFGVAPIVPGARSGAGEMVLGPWLLDGDDRPAAGSLTVLMDDVLGQACLPSLPAGRWALTTELSLRFPSPLPAAGVISARSRVVGMDEAGGTAEGSAVAADGTVVASGSVWLHVAPLLPFPDDAPPPPDGRRSGDLSELLAVDAEPGGRITVAPSPWLQNAQGAVHGGVLACLAEMAARRAATGPDPRAPRRRTASLHVSYVRRAVAPLAVVPEVLHRGRSMASVRVRVHSSDGRVAAEASHLSRVVGSG